MLDLNGSKPIFRKSHSINPYRVFFWLILILALMFVLRGFATGAVKPYSLITPTPTRTTNSYAMEAETQFAAGDLDQAIASYQEAVKLDPTNALLWAELARIQTYSSTQTTTAEDQRGRLDAALASINKALELAPDDSTVHAIRAFVLDWYAPLAGDKKDQYLVEAEQEATRALQLDSTNTLALAFYSEILVDQIKVLQAEEYIKQAINRDATLMDVHRIYAYVLESLRDYKGAIVEYEKAIAITPNLTFLHIRIGVNYRVLANNTIMDFYTKALEYFSQAATINEQLGIKDPIPYIAIAKTYAQMGEFFIASRNIRKALDFDPTSSDVYGQTGIIFYRAKNYEGAIQALKCSVVGCTPEESCTVRQCEDAANPAITVEALPLNDNTVVYYYTYGSALAGLHRKSNGYCQEGMRILSMVKAKYSGDKIIMDIINPSISICESYNYTLP